MVFHPHRVYPSPLDITAEDLAAIGVRCLLLDIDGTIAQTRDPAPSPQVVAWAEGLKSAGVTLFILSNNKHPARVRLFGEKLGCGAIHLAHKPRKTGFASALAATGVPPGETAMVGDQIFTDIFGARRMGLWAIRVESTDTYLWYFRLRRFFERPFLQARRQA